MVAVAVDNLGRPPNPMALDGRQDRAAAMQPPRLHLGHRIGVAANGLDAAIGTRKIRRPLAAA